MRFLTIAAAAAATTLALSGCGLMGGGEQTVGQESGGKTTLTVGASPTPHGDILRFVDENLAADAGLDLEIKEYTDYALPNSALVDGDLDANYFQHQPFFDEEVAGKGYKLAHFEGIHIEPLALFSDKVKDVKDLPDGAKIGINNDPSNQGRALALLAEQGLITTDESKTVVETTINDVKDNPKKFEFVEADAAQLARTLPDVDASVINGNNAIEAGLSPTEDGIAVESAEDSPYANFLAVRAGDEKDENIVKLNDLLHSDDVKKFIEENWPDGSVAPAF